MSDYSCPKCGWEVDATGSHDAGEHTCDQCGFEFIVKIEYNTPEYSTWCVVHDWGEMKEWGRFICRFCKNCPKIDSEALRDA